MLPTLTTTHYNVSRSGSAPLTFLTPPFFTDAQVVGDADGPPDVVVGGGEGWQHAYPRGDLVGETVRRQVDEVVSERSE